MRVKAIVKEFLYGLLFVIVVTISEFLVTLPLGNPWDSLEPEQFSQEAYRQLLNREFLLTAIPVAIIVFVFLKLRKTNDKVKAVKRGSLWTAVLTLNYVIVGLGNDNLRLILSTVGIYVLIAFSFMGTFTYVKYNKLS